ncbi:hypothetical protein R75465_07707 [Paraburkholderia aspalathi]|uniref:hypothetical protein n=1 Tax=Paraburkholderia aspalathi TaxID=1324617 RepID=UPI001B2A8C4B|nr:hypothetical protein [Paraburkholderia aspalathi]CAE6861850.1 hypothetical protein R75465_07707 [Paraburkholderia aspalathi]
MEILDLEHFDTVSYLGSRAVVRIAAVTNADIDVRFSFESIHTDNLSVHRRMISRIEPIEFEALVTVVTDGGVLNLDSVEILPAKHRMSFAGLEPDWMSHPNEEEQYDAEASEARNGHAF